MKYSITGPEIVTFYYRRLRNRGALMGRFDCIVSGYYCLSLDFVCLYITCKPMVFPKIMHVFFFTNFAEIFAWKCKMFFVIIFL
jgi:hypothetical protein